MRSRIVLLFLLAASLLPRLPLLANAEAAFSSDEAVNALAVQHLLAGRELSAFSWDATYYGMVEGLLAVPFAALLGPTALAFKLSAVAGFLLLVVSVFSLGRALYGKTEGLVAATLLAVFSPQLLLWSTLAVSGFCLIVAWGTLTLLFLFHTLRAPSLRRFATLGFLAGFGLYIFELYLPYLALLLLAGGVALVLPPWSLPVLRRRFGIAAAAVAGFVLGVAPKIALLWAGGRGSKMPSYTLAGTGQILTNLRLLGGDCIPALFGVNLRPGSPLAFENGRDLGPLVSGLGALLLLGYAASWAWALVQTARSTRTDGAHRWVEALLVVLVPLVALLFVLSPNPQDAGSNRYLLPWLSALPLAGAAVVRLGRRHLSAALAAGLLAVALPAAQSAAWLIDRGYLTSSLEVAVKRDPLRALLPALESRGLAGGYARYWDAYRATFFADERLVFVPYMGWNRYPPYSRQLAGTDRVAWVFPGESVELTPAGRAEVVQLEGLLRNQLASSDRPYQVLPLAGYRVYLGADGRRLLPAPLPLEPVPLARPWSEILSAPVPARAAAGSEIAVAVRAVNRSDAFWSASGLPLQAGALRVAASYRWLSPDGRALVDGDRSLLPGDVPPGGEVGMIVRARAPAEPGRYVLRLTFVQEGVAWFESFADRPVEVFATARSW